MRWQMNIFKVCFRYKFVYQKSTSFWGVLIHAEATIFLVRVHNIFLYLAYSFFGMSRYHKINNCFGGTIKIWETINQRSRMLLRDSL